LSGLVAVTVPVAGEVAAAVPPCGDHPPQVVLLVLPHVRVASDQVP
jgi:hypothetical protein